MIHPRLYEKLNAGSAETETFPVILYYCKPVEEVRRCITNRYGPIKYELPFIRAMALDLPAHKLKRIAKEPMVQWITDDITVSKVGEGPSSPGNPLPGHSRCGGFSSQEVPASAVVRRDPSARPVTVAVIDTGVSPQPDLVTPVNRIRAFQDFIGHKTEPYDDDGHGTHIAGIICGLASHPTQWNPDLVVIKALNSQGNGNASDILAAMQWTLNNSRHYQIRVVNLSLGVSADDDYDSDPLVRGVEALTRYGLCVVTAAGNSGPKQGTISSPGICKSAITVGAADGDHVASFSSRGPTPQGWMKPDLVAPGVNILSLDAERGAGDGEPPGYVKQSGTSMAAPFVSRAVAGICREFPGISPRIAKRILLRRTRPLEGEPPEAQGRGVLVES